MGSVGRSSRSLTLLHCPNRLKVMFAITIHRLLRNAISPNYWLLSLATAITIVLVSAVPVQAADVVFNFKIISDGTATFEVNNNPGNDSSANNLIIRTQDVITYRWEYAVNNGVANTVVLQATIPPEQAVANLPAACQPGSTLIADAAGNQQVTCQLGAILSGSSGSIDLQARLLSQRRAPVATFVGNGQLTYATGAITASNFSATPAPVTTANITISATPKVDLIKDLANVTKLAKGADATTDGLLIRYPITLATSGSGKGSEALLGNLTFTDQLLTRVGSADGPAVAGAQLYTWATDGTRACTPTQTGVNSYISRPFGKIGSPATATATNAVIDSGNWSCTQSVIGGPIQFTIAGANTTGYSTPTLSSNGTTLPANTNYLVSGIVHLWVPLSAVTNAGGSLNVRNKLSALSAIGASGRPNLEPTLTNNQYDHTLVGLGANINSYYSKSVDARSSALLPMSAIHGGDGLVMPNQGYAERLVLTNNGGLDWPLGTILCTAIDHQTQVLVPIAGTPTSAVKDFSSAPSTNYVIEYGTGSYATVTAQKTATCRDGDSAVWTEDIRTIPGGPDAVTKVRVRSLQPIAPNDDFDIALNLSARNNYLGTTTPIPLGTLVTEYSSYIIPGQLSGTENGLPVGWRGGRYDQINHTNVAWGDRLALTRALVRVDKQNVPNNPTVAAQADTEVTFNLLATVTAFVNPAPLSPVVTLQDILPATLDYVPGSATIAPTSMGVNSDQTKTLTWNLGTRIPNQIIPTISYRAKVRFDAANNSTAINTAIIASPDDASTVSSRTDTVGVNIGNASAFRIYKDVDTVLLSPNSSIGYALYYANTGSSDVSTSQFIDVFPYANDGRTPNTNYVGILAFNSITGNNGETFEFTQQSPASINPDPLDASNQLGGATKWCTTAQFINTAGCPSSNSTVTAVRINAPAFPKNTPTRTLRLILQPTGNAANSTYSNFFSGRANGLIGLLTSNSVNTRVRTPPVLNLVKRITAISSRQLTTVVDDPGTNMDNQPEWVPGYLQGVIDGGVVTPGDMIEYTIYFLSSGATTANNVWFCDRVPSNVSFMPTAFHGATPAVGGLAGDRGILALINGTTAAFTNIADGDAARYFPPGNDPTAVYPNLKCGGTNDNGAVVMNLGNLPNATAPSTPTGAFGFVRFKGRVK
jgi:uncharacterized repeat protein (TIGR01451 family)